MPRRRPLAGVVQNWRNALVPALLSLCVLLAGCGFLDDGPPPAGAGDGQLEAEVVTVDESNVTTVPYSDERVQSSEYLRTVVPKAVNETASGGDGRAVAVVPERAVDGMKDTIAALPDPGHDTRFNAYIRYENRTVGVMLAILE